MSGTKWVTRNIADIHLEVGGPAYVVGDACGYRLVSVSSEGICRVACCGINGHYERTSHITETRPGPFSDYVLGTMDDIPRLKAESDAVVFTDPDKKIGWVPNPDAPGCYLPTGWVVNPRRKVGE